MGKRSENQHLSRQEERTLWPKIAYEKNWGTILARMPNWLKIPWTCPSLLRDLCLNVFPELRNTTLKDAPQHSHASVYPEWRQAKAIAILNMTAVKGGSYPKIFPQHTSGDKIAHIIFFGARGELLGGAFLLTVGPSMLTVSFFAYIPFGCLLDGLSHCKRKSFNCK